MTRNLPPTAPTAVPLHFKIRKVSDIKPVVAWLHMFSKLQSLRLKYLCQQRRPAGWLAGRCEGDKELEQVGRVCCLKIRRVGSTATSRLLDNSFSCVTS